MSSEFQQVVQDGSRSQESQEGEIKFELLSRFHCSFFFYAKNEEYFKNPDAPAAQNLGRGTVAAEIDVFFEQDLKYKFQNKI